MLAASTCHCSNEFTGTTTVTTTKQVAAGRKLMETVGGRASIIQFLLVLFSALLSSTLMLYLSISTCECGLLPSIALHSELPRVVFYTRTFTLATAASFQLVSFALDGPSRETLSKSPCLNGVPSSMHRWQIPETSHPNCASDKVSVVRWTFSTCRGFDLI
jgi:hypothetical protein